MQSFVKHPVASSLCALMALTSAFSAPVIDAEYQQKDGHGLANKIQSTCDEERILIEVSSESGLGKAAIMLVKGDWTESVVIRFYLGGLEGLTISNGKVTLRDADIPTKVFDEHGKPHDGRYLGDGGRYVGKGYYEVAVPKSLLDKDTKSITIQWVDFYRR